MNVACSYMDAFIKDSLIFYYNSQCFEYMGIFLSKVKIFELSSVSQEFFFLNPEDKCTVSFNSIPGDSNNQQKCGISALKERREYRFLIFWPSSQISF